MKYFWGIVFAISGFLLIRYSIQITDTFGKLEWAERYLGSGLAGTYSFYRLLGLAIMIFSLLYMFGGLGSLTGRLAPYFGG